MHFLKYGRQLVDNGYTVVPITPGSKYPKGVTGWEKAENKEAVLSSWVKRYPKAGIGVLCTDTLAIDIDVYDKKVVKKLVSWLSKRLNGPIIKRMGEAPKILIPCRTEDAKKKRYSAAYVGPLKEVHRLEILGQGQQFVAYHVHPDTNREYVYLSEETLENTPRDQLPVLTDKTVKKLFKYFDSIAPKTWTLKSEKSTDFEHKTGLAGAKARVDLSPKKIRKILKSLPNREEEYDTYIQVGMGLHHQFKGADEGFQLWEKWCEKSAKNDEDANILKWRSFGAARGSAPVTFATVMKLASDKSATQAKEKLVGEKPVPEEAKALKGFLKRYAFMPEDNQILDTKRPLEYALLPIAAFKNLTANRRTEVDAGLKSDPDKTKHVPTWQLWLTHPKRMTVEGTTYRPGEAKRLVRSDDHRVLANMAHFPRHEKHYKSKRYDENMWRLDIFNRHMEYLFPIQEQRLWFLQWLAFNVQFPGRRSKVTPLHYSKPHGTGRGWLVNLIEALLGTWNVSKTQISEMCGEGSAGQFQDYLYRTLVCCVEEVRATDKRYAVSDALRDKLTENRLNVNLKYGGKATIDVHTNFFWMTNHADAMVIPVEDRRIHVMQGPDSVQPEEYYDDLYAWLEAPENVAHLWFTLIDMDLSGFNWKVAPKTKARERMIDYTESSTEELFKRWLIESKHDWLLFEDIHAQLGEMAERDNEPEPLSTAQIKKLLQNHCFHGGQMRLTKGGKKNTRRVRPWFIDSDQDPKHSLDYIRKRLKKSM